MIHDVVIPETGSSIAEGTVVRWLKSVGDPVRKGEPLVEVLVEKVTTELEAPADGVLAEVLVQEDVAVPVSTVIARIRSEG